MQSYGIEKMYIIKADAYGSTITNTNHAFFHDSSGFTNLMDTNTNTKMDKNRAIVRRMGYETSFSPNYSSEFGALRTL